MNEQHTKSFRAAYDYWFENKPLNEALSSLKTEEKVVAEEKKKEPKQEIVAEEKNEKVVKEGFDTHVLCNHCGSGDLQLSKKKTKIRCKGCGNTGLTESVVGLINKEEKKNKKK